MLGTLGVAGSTDASSLTYVTASSVKLNYPSSVRIDSSGQLYWSESGNFVVRKWNRNTNIVTVVGGTMAVSGSTDAASLAATSAHFASPQDVWPDTSGNVYVADRVSNVIRKIDTSTNRLITRLMGTYGTAGSTGNNGPASSALLNAPYGVACDSTGNVYVADYGNGAIRMVSQANGSVYLYAGQ